MHMNPWGTNSLLDTMVSLSQFGKQGCEIYKCAAEENRGTQGKTSDAKTQGPGIPFSQGINKFSNKKVLFCGVVYMFLS